MRGKTSKENVLLPCRSARARAVAASFCILQDRRRVSQDASTGRASVGLARLENNTLQGGAKIELQVRRREQLDAQQMGES